MELIVVDRRTASFWKPEPNDVLISINNVGDDPPKLRDGWRATLKLHFDDCDDSRFGVPINLDQAKCIVLFYQSWKDIAGRMVIHCNAGMCRSPGVALGLLDLFGVRFVAMMEIKYPLFNRFVRSMVVEAHAGKEPASK